MSGRERKKNYHDMEETSNYKKYLNNISIFKCLLEKLEETKDILNETKEIIYHPIHF